MSVVVLETGVMGRPMLLTDMCGFPEIALAGAGLVVEASVDGIQSGLRSMLKNREALGEMGRRLRTLTLQDYQWSSIVMRYVELYREVLSRSRRS